MNDTDQYNILLGVKNHFTTVYDPANRANIWGLGPVKQRGGGNNADCFVVVDPGVDPPLPAMLTIAGWNVRFGKRAGKRRRFKVNGPDNVLNRRSLVQASIGGAAGLAAGTVASARAGEAPAELATTIWLCPPPAAPPGPLMGGDAIYNSTNLDPARPHHTFWGTVAFVGGASAKARFRGSAVLPLANTAVSCAHVLHHRNGGDIRTSRYETGIAFGAILAGWPGQWPDALPASAAGWPDLATAPVTIAATTNTVRALGDLAGVAAPAFGDVVAKYGATTGLTVARDIGMVWIRLPDVTGDFYMVRAVSGQFCQPGDSGAAVVFSGNGAGAKRRKLAGFVLAGSSEDDQQYYLPAFEFGQTNSFAELSAVEIQI